jgi:hypothetical protein
MVAIGVPAYLTETAVDPARAKRFEVVHDPIETVETRLPSKLQTHPSLVGVEWKEADSECAIGSCGAGTLLRLRTIQFSIDLHSNPSGSSGGYHASAIYRAEARVAQGTGSELL